MTYSLQPWAASTSTAGTVESSMPQYVNGAQLATTQWDVTIDFKLTTASQGSSTEDVQTNSVRVVQLIMSPTHAKALAALINNGVTDWESKFGELPSVEMLMPPAPTGGQDAGQD